MQHDASISEPFCIAGEGNHTEPAAPAATGGVSAEDPQPRRKDKKSRHTGRLSWCRLSAQTLHASLNRGLSTSVPAEDAAESTCQPAPAVAAAGPEHKPGKKQKRKGFFAESAPAQPGTSASTIVRQLVKASSFCTAELQ